MTQNTPAETVPNLPGPRGTSPGPRPLSALFSPAVVRILLLILASLALWGGGCGFGPCRVQQLLYANVTIVAVDLIGLWFLASVLRRQGLGLRKLLASERPGRDLLVGLGLFFALAVVFLAANFLGNLAAYAGPPPMPGENLTFPLWAGLIGFLIAPATIALAEEAIYRGWLQPGLAGRLGTAGAIVVTAAVFAVQHLAFTLGDPQATVSKLITTFLAGLFLGWLRTRLASLWPLIIAHWLLDLIFLGLPMLFLAAR